MLLSNQPAQDLNIKKAKDKGPVDEVRTVGLRGPMLLSGWGYDIANNPVPSKENDITEFHEETTSRENWNTGPVNLIWDKERKVWSGGLEILCGSLATDITPASDPLTPTTFSMNVFRKTSEGKGAGALTESGESLTCYNRDPSLSQSAGDDVFVMVVRINYEWTPLWVGCP